MVSSKGKKVFKSYKTLAKEAKRSRKRAVKKNYKLYSQIASKGVKQCRSVTNITPVPSDAISLAQYRGNFGENEARILANRFGFGAE